MPGALRRGMRRRPVASAAPDGRPIEDLGFHEPWLVVDAILKRPRSDLGDWSLQYCNRKRPATYVRGTGDRRRWEIAVLPGENWAAISQTDKVFELLKPCVGPEDVELERVAVYCFHSDALAVDRRELADLTPPFLGQGMCAGSATPATSRGSLGACCRAGTTTPCSTPTRWSAHRMCGNISNSRCGWRAHQHQGDEGRRA